MSWYRDELPIEDSDRYVILRETAANCQLLIRKVEFVDQAEWKCVATNDYGTSVTSCFLKLQIPRHYKKPKFLECLRAILTEEMAVNLECKVSGACVKHNEKENAPNDFNACKVKVLSILSWHNKIQKW